MTPSITYAIDQVSSLLESEYGLTGELSRLAGENDNYRISTEDGRQYVLKIAAEDLDAEVFELEDLAVEAIASAGVELSLPRFVHTASGMIESRIEAGNGSVTRGRLLEFVSGTPWCEAGDAGSSQLRDLGKKLAQVDLALSSLDHPAAHRTHRWDLSNARQHRNKMALVEDTFRRRVVERMFLLYSACAEPMISQLPTSLIHGDPNDENVLVGRGWVTGLLDFGDCIHNPTVCELAIALAYAMLDQPDPVQAGAEVVAAYHNVRRLSLEELYVLFPLICGRLSVTVTVAAERRSVDPGRLDWFVTEERAWRLLEQLIEIDPAVAGTRLAAGTGLDPFDDRGELVEPLLERRNRHVSKALSIAYQEPLKMVRGRGQYLYDDRGRPFLDLVNNVCHVGHCHPRVVEAGQRQMARLNTNTRYLYDGLTEYVERLCSSLPESLDTCFLVNSGSEANELALRLAMTHTGRRDILVNESAYHGHTSRLIAASPYKFMGKGGSGQPESWVHVVPLPDGYRGLHKGHDRAVGEAFGDDVGEVISTIHAPIATFITESLSSVGGQIVPPPGYLETAFRHVRAAGGVCIADEVQVGFGRVGTHFWGFELQNVVPDIVVMGKPIGNGHPMAAVVTTREIAASFETGMEFFATFGGNPVSCAIGLAVLDVIRDEDLQQRALDLGTRFRNGLEDLMDTIPLIGDVRGAGLFIGVELVRDRATLEPAPDEADELINRMQRRGILLSTDGPHHNVIKIKPPMVLTADDIDMAVRVMGEELGEIAGA